MQQKSCLKFIYKLGSEKLRKSNWDLKWPLDAARRDYPETIVSLADSQVLRWIDELNGVTDVNEKVRWVKRQIREVKKQPKSRESKKRIKELYDELYDLQFQPDYVSIVMANNRDYDRANQGFKINGISYRRFLGTNGGIKNSTIVYVNAEKYPELKRRLDNGRKTDIPLVPAKLEAYQALVCSGSTPLPKPKGIIVIDDCMTKFTADVILLNDEGEGEPVETRIPDFEVEHNDSDGNGMMSPEYSRKVNAYFGGDPEKTVSGLNCRNAWTKGMLYCVDFIEFAEKVAGTYIIKDIWGDERDVRDADVILTGSMLKLWDCYDSWEDYYANCEKNGYQFSTTKLTPEKLENVRTSNYQFLQSLEFSDDEMQQLCQPTIDEINEVLGMDYRKSLVFLAGFGLNEHNVKKIEDNYIKALMIDKRMIDDPYVRKSIYGMIKKRIEMAKKGSIKLNANYAMIAGDMYALMQSMFGLEITGLLKAGEIYHKYWIDKGADELACFRAPMTNEYAIMKMKLNKSEEAAHWFQYIETAIVYNAWDTARDAMNGSDMDGDTNMDTDNPLILAAAKPHSTIMCVQRRAEKKIVTEEDIIQANKLAFNDEIGIVTNHATSMIEVQAGFKKGSPQWKELAYRIKCAQLFQQNTINWSRQAVTLG